jgi:hypothetical protein
MMVVAMTIIDPKMIWTAKMRLPDARAETAHGELTILPAYRAADSVTFLMLRYPLG